MELCLEHPKDPVVFSSVRSSSVYPCHTYIPAALTFPNFSNSSDFKVPKTPNMCYVFEKQAWDS